MSTPKLILYDALLREGPQTQGITLSVRDKLVLLEALDDLGVHVVEGGWPGANPKDSQFFREARRLRLRRARLAAFGRTRRASGKASKDPVLADLLRAGTSVVTIFGKTWDLHVSRILRVSPEQNLEIIADSVQFLKRRTGEVVYDAEHFFDGFKSNPQYALSCVAAALEAGADVVALCDTNGGNLPGEVEAAVRQVRSRFPDAVLGIHCHNDADLAVANSLAAVAAGAVQIQGCLNGYGERCGNANLTSLIPTLALKLKAEFVGPVDLRKLTRVSHLVDEVCNVHPRDNAPYVGKSAFAHKAGVHIAAVQRLARSYEHVPPESVGNERKKLVSDQAGKAILAGRPGSTRGLFGRESPRAKEVLETLKRLEGEGYQFEGAEASFEILLKKALGRHREFFELVGFRVIVERGNGKLLSEATVKLRVKGALEYTVAEGDGPVNALDAALRKALTPFYPSLRDVRLTDFKVRVLDAKEGTAAKVRVLIESRDRKESWGTVGVSENIIEASWQALVDSIDYKLLKDARKSPARKKVASK